MRHNSASVANIRDGTHSATEEEGEEEEIIDELDLYCQTSKLFPQHTAVQERRINAATACAKAASSSSSSSDISGKKEGERRQHQQQRQSQQPQRQTNHKRSSSNSSSGQDDAGSLDRRGFTTPFVEDKREDASKEGRSIEVDLQRKLEGKEGKKKTFTLNFPPAAPDRTASPHRADVRAAGATNHSGSSASTGTISDAEALVESATAAAVDGGTERHQHEQAQQAPHLPPLMPEFDGELLQLIKSYYLRKQTATATSTGGAAATTPTFTSPEASHSTLLGAVEPAAAHRDRIEEGDAPPKDDGKRHQRRTGGETFEQHRTPPPSTATMAQSAAARREEWSSSPDGRRLSSPPTPPLPTSSQHTIAAQDAGGSSVEHHPQQQQQQHHHQQYPLHQHHQRPNYHHPRSSLSHAESAPRTFAPFGPAAAAHHNSDDAAFASPATPPVLSATDAPRPPTFSPPSSYVLPPLYTATAGGSGSMGVEGGYGYDLRRGEEGQRFSNPPFMSTNTVAGGEGLHSRLGSDPSGIRGGSNVFRYGSSAQLGGGVRGGDAALGGSGSGATGSAAPPRSGLGTQAGGGNNGGGGGPGSSSGAGGAFSGGFASGLSALSSLPTYSSTSFVRAYVSDISLNLEPAIIVSLLTAALNMVVVMFLQHHVLDTRDHLGLFLIGSYMVFASYYMIYYFLERFSGSFRRIASQDKKFYIIGNLIKAGILVSITPFACIHLVKIIVLDEWESHILRNLGCIYAIPDFISMVIVRRMRWSTWVHHACVVVFNYFSIMNNYQHENVCRCVVVYAAFSSFAYCVNVLLASRFLGVSVNVARVLSFVALVVYALCCAVNWAWQVYYLRRLLTTGHEHWTVYMYMFLISLVMWDDIVLNRWLLHHARNNAYAASQHLQQHRMRQQQQQQQQQQQFTAQPRAAAMPRGYEERQGPLPHPRMPPRAQ